MFKKLWLSIFTLFVFSLILQAQTNYPNGFKVYDNRPNPFNPATTITFYLPETGNVTVKVYDIMGREVSTLLNNVKEKGLHYVVWDSKNNNGSPVSSGIYLYNVQFDNYSVTKKMLLVR